jgi:hypothetical protein
MVRNSSMNTQLRINIYLFILLHNRHIEYGTIRGFRGDVSFVRLMAIRG